MNVTIHRGSQEVGGSCIEVQAQDCRIVLDVGLPLFNDNREALDTFSLRRMTKENLQSRGILPAVSGLFDDARSPDAILLSHAHLDHTGLLDHTNEQIPVYATSGTSKIMLVGKLFANQVELPRARFREVLPGTSFQIGPFAITGYSVDHSTFGCLAYLIEADGKSLLYTGDLRLHGRKPGMARSLIDTLADRQVDAMLMEGTHFGLPDGHGVSEYDLEREIVGYIQDATSLVLAAFSPQHVDRLVAFIRAAKKTNRKFVADVYTAAILHFLSSETKVPSPQRDDSIRVYFPNNFAGTIKERNLSKLVDQFRSKQIEMSEIVESPSKFLMVFRPSLEVDFPGSYPDNTLCLYSSWKGYLEKPDWKRTRQSLTKNGGHLVEAHTSGHMHAKDIVTFVRKIAPQAVIPIHTFEPTQFREHFPNAVLAEDGRPVEIT
ncbi:hypothetical protein C5Y96_14940 [Blastopirellula marina]|uniref:Metallo-beta-lactamase domain-containing protein n=1 Tax=Blastopirellula marina TaxID=124 RepID=A0A2S8FF35_9BACT|nr:MULTISPECIES: MBL fold metallo-hydrolase [Pirellulaceae]PQO30752.1 hypothetical protein C5Y96_14940 [Blastopirellula marina]RCS50889.1 MBL fold metallo-hydrolase [Bremerella cremea]